MNKRLRFMRVTQLSDILERDNSRKPKVWRVRNVQSGVDLGRIKWLGRWRQYSFDPEPNLTFEKTCLRTIADFCERATKRYYAALRLGRLLSAINQKVNGDNQ